MAGRRDGSCGQSEAGPAERAALLNDFACRAELIMLILLDSLAGGGQEHGTRSPGHLSFYHSSSCSKKKKVLPTPFLP